MPNPLHFLLHLVSVAVGARLAPGPFSSLSQVVYLVCSLGWPWPLLLWSVCPGLSSPSPSCRCLPITLLGYREVQDSLHTIHTWLWGPRGHGWVLLPILCWLQFLNQIEASLKSCCSKSMLHIRISTLENDQCPSTSPQTSENVRGFSQALECSRGFQVILMCHCALASRSPPVRFSSLPHP